MEVTQMNEMSWYTLPANETRKTVESLGGPMRVLVGADDSARTISVLEQRLDGPGGPPLHVHDDADEILMVIDGGPLTVVVGTERRLIEKGGMVFVPRGTPHAFSNLSGAPLVMLGIATPGGIEKQLDEQARYFNNLRGAPEESKIVEIWGDKGRIIGPPVT
jgi:mannose-6-phosphate isomerase-like protein (cupin superfamily)